MKLIELLKDSLKIPVEWNFIKKVVGNSCKIGMIDYESITQKTTLKKYKKKMFKKWTKEEKDSQLQKRGNHAY